MCDIGPVYGIFELISIKIANETHYEDVILDVNIVIYGEYLRP